MPISACTCVKMPRVHVLYAILSGAHIPVSYFCKAVIAYSLSDQIVLDLLPSIRRLLNPGVTL
jgi:hypothetical protein